MDHIPSEVVNRRLLEIAAEQLDTKDFKSHTERATVKGDNYIGVVYRVQFWTECKSNSKKSKELNLIVKVPPENKIRREQFFARPSFLREAMAYDEILPMFMEFQQSKGIIPTEDGFYQIAPCYGTITEELHEAIILKDLSDEGFTMYNRHNYLTLDNTLLVMQILGKLHALSYAIKDQCPEKIEKYQQMKDIFEERKNETELAQYMTFMKDRAITTLDPDQHSEYIDKIQKLFENQTYIEIMLNMTRGSEAEPYAVICHGDCWNNNILYQYENGKLTDARLVDWQIFRYASPVCDLMYFIFLATSSEMRSEHYTAILDTYYGSLTSFLTRLGSNPEKLFPRKDFDDQLKKFGKFGFLMACMLVAMLTAASEDVPDLDEIAEQIDRKEIPKDAFNSHRNEAAYRERMKGVILDMFKLGYM